MRRLETEEDILAFIENDEELMKILALIRELDLSDSWLCAGLLRSRIWDNQSGFSFKTPVHDVDVVYFDQQLINYDYEQEIQTLLKTKEPSYNWEVKNEARMHVHHPGSPRYISTTDAISKFPETVTAIGARLNANDQVILTAPHGVEDLLTLTVRPTPSAKETEERMNVYKKRVGQKDWGAVWPSIKLLMD